MNATADLVRLVADDRTVIAKALEAPSSSSLATIQNLYEGRDFMPLYKSAKQEASDGKALLWLESLRNARATLLNSAVRFLAHTVASNEEAPKPVISAVNKALKTVETAVKAFGKPIPPNAGADTQEFSNAVNSVKCVLTKELLLARWNGIQNGLNKDVVLSDFRKQNSKKLGKTKMEQDKKWATIRHRASVVIKPFESTD